jgi:hypothetical protein
VGILRIKCQRHADPAATAASIMLKLTNGEQVEMRQQPTTHNFMSFIYNSNGE